MIKLIASLMVAFVVFVALVGGIVTVGWGVSWVTAPFRGAIDARETIQADGDFRIQAYQYFYNQCASIKRLEADIDAQAVALETTSNEQFRQIIQTNLAGLRAARQGAILQYNQDSHKQWMEAQFKSAALPYKIPDSPYEGVRTLCAY